MKDTHRPVANHSLEQFLMTPESLQAQADRVGSFLAGKRVFFLGDDDHISPLLARDFGVEPVVYEIDERVRNSLSEQFGSFGIDSAIVSSYDARNPIVISEPCEAFYINPPYSSKSEGLGIKIWLMRALEACQEKSVGILVMPWNGGSIQAPWVGDVQASIQQFLANNGLYVTAIDHNVSSYEEVNDKGLLSSNLYLEQINLQLHETVDIGELYN
jgi:predicted methyltransferase